MSRVDTHTIIGYLAANLTTLSLVPQVVKMYSSKDTKGVSMAWLLWYTMGATMWFVYGVMGEKIWPVIISSIGSNALAVMMIVLKIYYEYVPVNALHLRTDITFIKTDQPY